MGAAAAGCESPQTLCEKLSKEICERVVQCVAPDDDLQACTDVYIAASECNLVVDVSDRYDDCVADLNEDSCASLFPEDMLGLPDSCTGVLLIDRDQGGLGPAPSPAGGRAD